MVNDSKWETHLGYQAAVCPFFLLHFSWSRILINGGALSSKTNLTKTNYGKLHCLRSLCISVSRSVERDASSAFPLPKPRPGPLLRSALPRATVAMPGERTYNREQKGKNEPELHWKHFLSVLAELKMNPVIERIRSDCSAPLRPCEIFILMPNSLPV